MSPIISRLLQILIWQWTAAIFKHQGDSKYYEYMRLNSLSWDDNSLSVHEKAGRSVYCHIWIDFKSIFCIHYHSNHGLWDWRWAVHYQTASAGDVLSASEGRQRTANNLYETFDSRGYCLEFQEPVVIKFKPPVKHNDEELFWWLYAKSSSWIMKHNTCRLSCYTLSRV